MATQRLGSFTELRFKARDAKVIFILRSGQCEWMGTNMALQKEYHAYQGTIFCWFGPATIDVIGEVETCYVSKDVMPFLTQCVALSFALDCERQIAKEKGVKGPSLFVCGETMASTQLANWALRLGTTNLVFADFDLQHNIVTRVPCCIGAMVMTETCDFDDDPIFPTLGYCVGRLKNNAAFYAHTCQLLIAKIKERTSDAGNLIKGTNDTIKNTNLIQWMQPDIVIVIGNEEMYQKLHQDSSLSSHIPIFYFNQNNGLQRPTQKESKKRQMDLFQSHFKECVPRILSPSSIQIKEMVEEQTPISMLPLDQPSRLPRFFWRDFYCSDAGSCVHAAVYASESRMTEGMIGIAKMIANGNGSWTVYSDVHDANTFQVIHF